MSFLHAKCFHPHPNISQSLNSFQRHFQVSNLIETSSKSGNGEIQCIIHPEAKFLLSYEPVKLEKLYAFKMQC